MNTLPDFAEIDIDESNVASRRRRGSRECRHCLDAVAMKAVMCPTCGCPVEGNPPTLAELAEIKKRGPVNLRECPECYSAMSVRAHACMRCGCGLTATPPPLPPVIAPPPLPGPPKGGTTYARKQPEKEMSLSALTALSIIGFVALCAVVVFLMFGDDRENARTFLSEPGWYRKYGGERVELEVLQRADHLFSDGKVDRGVQVRWANGDTNWIYASSFDHQYEQR